MDLLYDTGAQSSCLTKDTASQLFPTKKLQTTSSRCQAAGNMDLGVVRESHFEVKVKGKTLAHHLQQNQRQHHRHRSGQWAGNVLQSRDSATVLHYTNRQLIGRATQSFTPSLLNHHHPGKIHWPLGQKSHIRRHGLQPPDPICVWGTRHGRHHQRQDLTNRGHQHCTS